MLSGNNSYCTACNLQRHRIGKRKDHTISRISQMFVKVAHVPPDEDSLFHPKGILCLFVYISSLRIVLFTDHEDARLTGLLLKHFKRPSFRDWQLHVISASLEGKNTLVVKPTGSGKSLCFQFPGLVTGKMTVVLMPTISLIMDQVHNLQGSGMRVTHLGMMQTDSTVITKLAEDQYDILLRTPESLYDQNGEPKPVFKSLSNQRRIGLIAVDEAHLMKTWRSFR